MLKSFHSGFRFSLLLSSAAILFFTAACERPLSNSAKGTLYGVGGGAGAGALIGSQVGEPAIGAAIGAGFGALSGGLIGSQFDAQERARFELEEMRVRQRVEINRQQRELEDIKRQQRYDELYQRY